MNPEFRRNLWLELSLPRLLLTPILLGLAFATIGWGWSSQSQALVARISWWAFWGFVLVWGGRRAAASITDELSDGTWHGQRMSSLGAWPMTWGKLIGATAFAWYGALLCLGVHMATWRLDIYAACPSGPDGSPAADCRALFSRFWGQPLLMIVVGLGAQAAALGIAIARHVQNPLATRLSMVPGQILWVLLLGVAWNLLVAGPAHLGDAAAELLSGVRRAGAPPFEWFGWRLPQFAAAGAVLVALCGLAAFAADRLMRVALQHLLLPWGCFMVAAVLTLYLAGLRDPLAIQLPMFDPSAVWGSGLLLFALGVFYVALLMERKDAVQLARLVAAPRYAGWRRTLELAPGWLGALLVVLCLSTAIVVRASGEQLPLALMLVAGWLCFVVRDIAIVHWWSLGASPMRADLSALITLLVLYALLPALVLVAGAHELMGMFMPQPGSGPLIAVGVPLLEAAAAIVLASRRWRASRPAVSSA